MDIASYMQAEEIPLNIIFFAAVFYSEAEGCPDHGDIAQGVRVLNGTQSGDVVTFRCDDGYDLLGFRQLMCGEDLEWEQVWPRCMKGS